MFWVLPHFVGVLIIDWIPAHVSRYGAGTAGMTAPLNGFVMNFGKINSCH
jgi:hypothetical protein